MKQPQQYLRLRLILVILIILGFTAIMSVTTSGGTAADFDADQDFVGAPLNEMEAANSLAATENITLYLPIIMKHHPWDCFMILFGESDGTAHQFWKYTDPKSPLFVDHPLGLRDSILRVYQELDRQTGELIKELPSEATVLMMLLKPASRSSMVASSATFRITVSGSGLMVFWMIRRGCAL